MSVTLSDAIVCKRFQMQSSERKRKRDMCHALIVAEDSNPLPSCSPPYHTDAQMSRVCPLTSQIYANYIELLNFLTYIEVLDILLLLHILSMEAIVCLS